MHPASRKLRVFVRQTQGWSVGALSCKREARNGSQNTNENPPEKTSECAATCGAAAQLTLSYLVAMYE